MGLLIYNLLLPAAFLFFVPSLILKLLRRTGPKGTYLERFGFFSAEKRKALTALESPIWIHSVSVGETILALDFMREWKKISPGLRFVLSTTTTTGQEIAQTKSKGEFPVFYCPIDFPWAVGVVLRLVRPKMLVIFETELWPNMIHKTSRAGVPIAVVNARMTENSHKGYQAAKLFFKPILSRLSLVCAQSEADSNRFHSLSPDLRVEITGTMKFDFNPPTRVPQIDLEKTFGPSFGLVIVGASTHPGEEKLLAEAFLNLEKEFPGLRIILAPRHAERGGDVASELKSLGLEHHRRSSGVQPPSPVRCLLADTTGELVSLMSAADVVFMGKTLAGNEGGHNVIEPAMLGKPVLTGARMTNFKSVMEAMLSEEAIVSVESDSCLLLSLRRVLSDPEWRAELGRKGKACVERRRGATVKTIKLLQEFTCNP